MNDQVLSTLYPEELYQLNSKTTIVLESWSKLTVEERQLLSKILGAVKLNLDAVQIIEQPILNLTSLPIKPRSVVCFTKAAAGLSPYEPMEVAGVALVISASLKELLGDEACRKRLWGALKTLFSV